MPDIVEGIIVYNKVMDLPMNLIVGIISLCMHSHTHTYLASSCAL